MENDRADRQERVRLPEFDVAQDAQSADRTWAACGRPTTGSRRATAARDTDIRRASRVSSWTAAALVAGVAVTTGYFAHNVAATTAGGSTGTATQTGKSTAGAHGTPVLHGPVVTSGGSGAVGGGTGGAGGGTGGAGGTSSATHSTTWRDS
jgi:hypothetical protein